MVTFEFARRRGNLKPKRFDFCIEHKLIDQTCPFHYQWPELFGLFEEIGIKPRVAFLKFFSIFIETTEFTDSQSENHFGVSSSFVCWQK